MLGNVDDFYDDLVKENKFSEEVKAPEANEPKDIAKIVEEATKKAFQDATKDSPIMVKKVEPISEEDIEPEIDTNVNEENNNESEDL